MQTLIRLIFLATFSTSTLAMDQILINLVVNGLEQGDVEAVYDQGGYWIAEQALKGAGLNTLDGKQQQLGNRIYYRADQIKGISSRIDQAELTIYLDAAAHEFGEKTLSLRQQHAELYPEAAPFSGYLSYRLSALHQAKQDGINYQISPTLNLNGRHFNFRSEHDYNSQDNQWRRINTSVEYDRPELMLRASAGDLMPRQAALGFSQAMAGFGISRVFSMQPDFESAPSFQTQAAITQPSTAEVYLNGQRIKTIDLQPGVYQLSDLQYFSGLQNVELIIKDQYGGVQNFALPYYFDDSLLKAGLSEFNYNIGLRRVNGSFDQYDGLAYSAFHRIGVTDWLTLGAQAGGNQEDRSQGVFANIKLGQYGVLGAVLSWADHDTQGSGHAQQIQYRYSNAQFSLYANGQRQSPDYWRYNNDLLPIGHIDWSANLGASWGSSQWGQISVEYGRQQSDDAAQNLQRYTVGYAISPLRNTSLTAQIRKTNSDLSRDWSGFLNLSLTFGSGHSLYSGAQYRDHQMLYAGTLSKSTPTGPGWGYGISAQQQATGTDYIGWLERKLQHGQASASVMQTQGPGEQITNWRASWQGALAYSHGQWAATRYIQDSFAVVDAGLPNIGIIQNGSELGKSNEAGWLMLPEISSFGYQQLGLVQNDIPIEYSVDRLQTELLSGNRDGRKVKFKLKKMRAVSGQLFDIHGEPIRNTSLSTQLDGENILISTSLDGRFYTEQLPPGVYTLESQLCNAIVSITPSEEIVTELAPVQCLAVTEK